MEGKLCWLTERAVAAVVGAKYQLVSDQGRLPLRHWCMSMCVGAIRAGRCKSLPGVKGHEAAQGERANIWTME